MWEPVTPSNVDSPAPSARAKHSATLVGGHVYLLGGRNGNMPMKDFWKYDLAENKWTQINAQGERPPVSLQEHTAVAYKDCMYVFGGEVSLSTGTETPLWVYDIRRNVWRKMKTPRGVSVPRGRRGHTALVHRGSMLIYGGYQDLRGSSNELWAFHFETESWHLISSSHPPGMSKNTGSSSSSSSSTDSMPPARHKHSAVIHDDSMWVYGGMTDLQERADLWKWDTVSSTWTIIKLKHHPGPLHSHAACKIPGSMLIFGGERGGHSVNELWKFSFATEIWEKIQIDGLKPQPRSESIAFTVPELLLQLGLSLTTTHTDNNSKSSTGTTVRLRPRTSSSVDRSSRHSSYLPQNRVSPFEKTYVFQPTTNNYIDGSDESFHRSLNTNTNSNYTYRSAQPGSFLREIQKLSQLNLSKLSHTKCNYSVLNSTNNDSTESLLRQHGTSSQSEDSNPLTTPVRNMMVKSQSAHFIKYRTNCLVSPSIAETSLLTSVTSRPSQSHKKHVRNESCRKSNYEMTREPISVPNFSTLVLPTPVLTPVEAARLVFVDTDDENDDDFNSEVFSPPHKLDVIQVQPATTPGSKEPVIYENFKSALRDDSYSSHLCAPVYQNMPKSTSVKFHPDLEEVSDENSTSDYASIEAVNRISSASSHSVRPSPASETKEESTVTSSWTNFKNKIKTPVSEGPFGFCNPNYMGPDIQELLSSGRSSWNDSKAQQYAKLLNTPDSGVDDSSGRSNSRQLLFMDEMVEMKSMDHKSTAPTLQSNTFNIQKFGTKKIPPNSLALDGPGRSPRLKSEKSRASSASRAERHRDKRILPETNDPVSMLSDPSVPLNVFIIGGKEQGQITVFKRPISVWKLKLY